MDTIKQFYGFKRLSQTGEPPISIQAPAPEMRGPFGFPEIFSIHYFVSKSSCCGNLI